MDTIQADFPATLIGRFMHIAEGILSGPVLMGGGLLTVVGMVRGVRELSIDETPKTAMIAALCFTAALIHIPIGPAGTHLMLNGVAGILLGWKVFPALLCAFLLHSIMFQFGGITVLGINTAIAAWPAVAVHVLYRQLNRVPRSHRASFWIGALLGAAAVTGAIGLQATALTLSGSVFSRLAMILALVHLPVIVFDGAITGLSLNFLNQRRPDLLDNPSQQLPSLPMS